MGHGIKVPLESQNEQSAAEGLRVTVSMSGLTAYLQVFRAGGEQVGKRLQRGAGHGSRGGRPTAFLLRSGNMSQVLCFHSENGP